MGRQEASKKKAGKFCKPLIFLWNENKISFCKISKFWPSKCFVCEIPCGKSALLFSCRAV